MKDLPFKAAIFDMDGTLTDSLGAWDVFWHDLGATFGKGENFRPTAEDDRAVRTMLIADAMELIHDHYDMGKDGAELYVIVEDVTRRYYRETVTLKEGVKEFLDELKARKIPMIVASATQPDLLHMAAERLGLYEYFDTIVSCADVGVGKEKPDVFLKALNYLNVNKEDACVFEDSYVAAETAHRCGFQTVGIYDQYAFEQERLKAASNVYVGPGETLMKLV